MDVKTQSPEAQSAKAMQHPAKKTRGQTADEPTETLASFAVFVLKLVVAVLVFRIFIFTPFTIPSESMLPRLQNGDFLLAAKWPYGYSNYSLPYNAPLLPGRIFGGEPARGDVVIFKHPVDETDYVKRVIGLPGDTVALRGGQVFLNGEPLPREPMADFEIAISPNTGCAWGGIETTNAAGELVCRYNRFRETLPGGRSYEVLDFGPYSGDDYAPRIIPEGHLFVMGDNRDNSRDSRFEARAGDAVGILPQDLLVGRASIIMFSTDGSAEWLNPVSWFTATRWERIGDVI